MEELNTRVEAIEKAIFNENENYTEGNSNQNEMDEDEETIKSVVNQLEKETKKKLQQSTIPVKFLRRTLIRYITLTRNKPNGNKQQSELYLLLTHTQHQNRGDWNTVLNLNKDRESYIAANPPRENNQILKTLKQLGLTDTYELLSNKSRGEKNEFTYSKKINNNVVAEARLDQI
ncbi:8272_t:CDS:2 [Dentiscutata erythropus]|uniref:8272_t:CDS:1 n=1 Tax=Dentiscutata erythropus TaxID=1348616 RepID=A0A9N9IG65_9GLOM|nr:8272_t:CDS:2 [Dentiscutata erythropus]